MKQMQIIKDGTVILIEDNDLIRESLTEALILMGFKVFSYKSALHFLNEYYEIVCPTVIVLDMQMPDMTGIELQYILNSKKIIAPIIFISGESYPQQIITAMKQGAADFLLKPLRLDDVYQSITNAMTLHIYLSKYLNSIDKLTMREKEVFYLLANGKNNKAVARELDITESTIKLHKSKIMQKMQVKSVQELTAVYLRSNISLNEIQSHH
ncbi:MAG: response regulator [Methylococcales bacterium]|nr:response regulator [Methylococcales bacterium]